MLGKLPWGWKLPILCVLLATCDGGLVKDKDPGPTTEKPPGGRNATLKCQPPETRRTLEHDDFEVLPDGTLLVWQSRDSVNASSYALSGDGTARACLPPSRCLDGFVVMKPLYFAMSSVLFHAQVPMYVLTNLCFNGRSPLVYVAFFYTILIVYVTPPFCPIPVTLWYNVPSCLSLAGLHLAGGLAMLHSDVVLNGLAETGHIYVKKGTIYIRKVRLIAEGTACLGAVIFALTYMLIVFRPFDDVTLEFSPLRHHMRYFLPSCLVYMVVNLILAGLSACATPAAISGDEWRKVRYRHLAFFMFFFSAFFNWISGFFVSVTRCWNLFGVFVFYFFASPIVLCCCIHSISRKVIYADQESVKILETNGEVWTLWTNPPKSGEETGSDEVKKSTTKREFGLAFYSEKNKAGKEKQPAAKEIIDQLALVVAKIGGDKEKQLEEENFELALLI